MIVPLAAFPHTDIVNAEMALEEEEETIRMAESRAYQRKCAENVILAQKKADDKKRLAIEKAAETSAASSMLKVSSAQEVLSRREFSKSQTKSRGCDSSSSDSSNDGDDREEGSESDDNGFTLAGYKGDVNDVEHSSGRKLVATANYDLNGDHYGDLDSQVVENLKNGGVQAMRDFILRGGNVAPGDILTRPRVSTLSDKDDVWSDTEQRKPSNGKRRSQLEGLTFDECEGAAGNSKNLFVRNSTDTSPSSASDSEYDSRAATAKKAVAPKTKRKKRAPKSTRPSRDSSLISSSSEPGDSSDSDSAKKKKKKQRVVKAKDAGVTSFAEVAASDLVDGDDDDDKPVRKRELVSLTEQTVQQYANVNRMPFQMTVAQCQSSKSDGELFEVDGELMSDDQLKTLIFDDVETITKNVDTKFLSFVRQHIMVDVFKDVYFLTNVISYFRSKRFLHHTADSDYIICEWQEILSGVAADLIRELEESNEQILKTMDANLRNMREIRKEKREASQREILSTQIADQIELDLKDLEDYKTQMKLTKKSLEDIAKVAKRRINSFAHSTGAKMVCIWARLNGFRHLLTETMSKFEKKFLLDPSMPFYSVLSDDLSRKWGAVATSPSRLFPGIDLAGRNNSEMISSSSMSTTSSNGRNARFSGRSTGARDIATQDIDVGLADNETDRFDEESTLPQQLSCGSMSPPRVHFQRDESAHSIPRGDEFDNLETTSSTQHQSGLLTGVVPTRPSTNSGYTSALFREEHSPVSNSSPGDDGKRLSSSDSGRPYISPASQDRIPGGRTGVALSVSRKKDDRPSISYLSSTASSFPRQDAGNSICDSNAAVLFDALKNMTNDRRDMEGMFRFIEVMNVKSPSVAMPATKSDTEAILAKGRAKKAKVGAAKDEAKKAAAGVTTTVSPDSTTHLPAAVDTEWMWGNSSSASNNSSVDRFAQRTESYSLFQKLFVFLCGKRVEAKDRNLNLQIFGERLVRTLKNSVLLRFLLLLLRNKKDAPNVLAVYLVHTKDIFTEFKCYFGVAYSDFDYFNILGDGYCVLRCMFALFCNEKLGFKLSAADMKHADKHLFATTKSRREFYSFLTSTRESIGTNCNDEVIKTADKNKLKTLMTLFAAFPQLKQVPGAYWACLDWVAYAPFNCTSFSTNYFDCVPGYAQMHCSSNIRKDAPSAEIGIVPFTLDEVYRVLTVPVAPNYCVLEGQHAFVIKGPSKEDGIESFMNVLGLFLGECLKNLAIVEDKFSADFAVVETVIVKMIEDNSYVFDDVELNLMTSICQYVDAVGANRPRHVVVSPADFVEAPNSIVEDRGRVDVIRAEDGGVVDLCDSDTGDVDRIKSRAAKALAAARGDQELTVLKFKVRDEIIVFLFSY